MDQKTTAAAIVSFLRDQKVTEEQQDSIDFAVEAICDTFNVSETDVNNFSAGGLTLPELLTRGINSGESASSSVNVPVTVDASDEETRQKADALKLEGNQAIANRDFELAVQKYTDALNLIPDNVVYLSNRAAAYSSLKQHEKAVADAEKATSLQPDYAKAWSRLGLAKFALSDFKGSMDAYKKGLDIGAEDKNDTMKKGYETAKQKMEDSLMSSLESSTTDAGANAGANAGAGAGAGAGGFPDLGNLSSMLGGLGGEGGLGGILNNPQFMQAAQQMMQNPDSLRNMMQNPQLQNMARSFGLDSSTMDSVMNDPNLANMARNFMGGAGSNNEGNGSN